MNTYHFEHATACLADIDCAAHELGLFYSRDLDALTNSDDYAENAQTVGAYFSAMNAGRYGNKNFDVFLTWDDLGRLRRLAGLEYCEDVDAYCAGYTYIEDGGYYVYETWDYYYCDDCGAWYTYDGFDHDRGYCYDCADKRGVITYYHAHKGQYTFFGNDPRRIGVELEVDGADCWDDCNGCARDVQSVLDNHAFFEEDGSLDCGFEIITHPHTLEEFFALDWRRAFNAVRDWGLTSHDARTCGLHIHFAREWFGDNADAQDDALVELLNFYHANYETLYKLSRRTSQTWCANDRSAPTDVYDLDDKKDDNDHGRAVNLGNWRRLGTVEFRLGRGTLNYETFAAWIDLHVAIVERAAQGVGSYEWDAWINPDTVSARAWEYICDKLGTPADVLEDVAENTQTAREISAAIDLDGLAEIMDALTSAAAVVAGV